MTNHTKTSVTDIPRDLKKQDKDQFGIEPFENGLIRFVSQTSTPITIALQGEWGSGKTSLMNSLEQKLCSEKESQYFSIWLNTWEYSLMNSANETLIEIILALIKEAIELSKEFTSKSEDLLKKTKNVVSIASKLAIKFAGNQLADGLGTDISEQFNSDSKSSIAEIRNELQEIINLTIEKSNKKGFIFFIDDLDRIDPPVAVQLLELLKNIFTLDNCVFVLAIDYDVVVKGLEPKFGKLNEKNEREFRSFFDKIIQVPFSMPVGSYNVDDFIKDNLVTIGYITEDIVKDVKIVKEFANYARHTVGTNPRSLKRLLNSLSLIDCINLAQESDASEPEVDSKTVVVEKLLNFALVSIQISYPQIYRILSMNPGFNKWDESLAIKLNLKPLEKESIEKLSKMDEFDEEWEQVLYRFCEREFFLKKNVLNISTVLNSMRLQILSLNEIEDENDDSRIIENTLTDLISISSVTSIEAFDKPVVNYHKGSFLKGMRDEIIPRMKDALPEIRKLIQPQGKRVQTNAYIKFHKKDWADYLQLYTYPYKGQVRLVSESGAWFCYIESNLKLSEIAKKYSLEKEFNKMIEMYTDLKTSFPKCDFRDVKESFYEKDDVYRFSFWASLDLQNVDCFFDDENISLFSEMLIDWKKFWIEFYRLSEIIISKQKV